MGSSTPLRVNVLAVCIVFVKIKAGKTRLVVDWGLLSS
jgi:hypothetical protein